MTTIVERIEQCLRPHIQDDEARARAMAGIEAILQNVGVVPVTVESEKQPAEIHFGDIIFDGNKYYIGGKDSPVRFGVESAQGRVLEYLLKHIDEVFTLQHLAKIVGKLAYQVDSAVSGLITNLNMHSASYRLERLPHRISTPTKIRLVVRQPTDQVEVHPNFSVNEQRGDIYIGTANYYIGTPQRGLYGLCVTGTGRALRIFLDNVGNEVNFAEFQKLHIHDASVQILTKKVNGYSTIFRIDKIGSLRYALKERNLDAT